MVLKEKLIKLIQEAVGGCAKYWAGLIAEHLIGNGVVVPVLCKDCTRFKDGYCTIRKDSWGGALERGGHDFCSDGERKSD